MRRKLNLIRSHSCWFSFIVRHFQSWYAGYCSIHSVLFEKWNVPVVMGIQSCQFLSYQHAFGFVLFATIGKSFRSIEDESKGSCTDKSKQLCYSQSHLIVSKPGHSSQMAFSFAPNEAIIKQLQSWTAKDIHLTLSFNYCFGNHLKRLYHIGLGKTHFMMTRLIQNNKHKYSEWFEFKIFKQTIVWCKSKSYEWKVHTHWRTH